MNAGTIGVEILAAPSPPGKGEWLVVVVERAATGELVRDAVAVCPSKLAAQTVSEALRAYYRC